MSDDTERTIGPYVVGEKPVVLEYQFLDSNGAPLNLTGYTAKFNYTERDGVATSAVASITDAVNGKVHYTWTGAEMPTPGTYAGMFWVGNTAQRFASLKINWQAALSVGPVPNI